MKSRHYGNFLTLHHTSTHINSLDSLNDEHIQRQFQTKAIQRKTIILNRKHMNSHLELN